MSAGTRLGVAGALATTLLAACGGGSAEPAAETTAAETTATVATTSSATEPTAPSTLPATAPPVAAGPSGPCEEGELPAVGALDLATGDTRWVMCSPIETYRSALGTTGDVVVVEEGRDGVGHTVAIDAADGTELWRWPSPSSRMTPGPVAGSGVVVVLTGEVPLWDPATDAELIGVDAMTGEELWRVPEPLEVVGTSETVVAAQRYDELMGAHPISGYDRLTGEQLWVSEVVLMDYSGVFGGVYPTAAAGDLLVVPTGETSATALDLGSGEVAWTSAELGTPAGFGDVVIGLLPVQGPDAEFRAVDPATGASLWSAPGTAAYGGYLAVGDGIVVGANPMVAYEQASGNERWRAEGFNHPHAVVDERVISLWESGIDARSAVDGSIEWQVSEPFGSPYNNNLVVSTTDVFVAVNSLPWGD